jgi:hypothetical protein
VIRKELEDHIEEYGFMSRLIKKAEERNTDN